MDTINMELIRLLFGLDVASMNYYIQIAIEKNLSVRSLEYKIKSKEYERLPMKTRNKITADEKIEVKDLVPNPILIRNKNNLEIVTEKALHQLILEDPTVPGANGYDEHRGIRQVRLQRLYLQRHYQQTL